MGLKGRAPGRLRRAVAVALVGGIVGGGVTAAPASAVPEDFPPDAVNDSVTATSGEDKVIDALANDSNPDEDGLEISAVGAAVNGTVTTDGVEITYTPEVDYVGPDSFTYTVLDGGGATDTATVTVDVRECSGLAAAIDDAGIVTGEDWMYCSSYEAVASVGDMTPVMNMSGSSQALITTGTVEGANPPNNDPGLGSDNGTVRRGGNDVSIVALDLLVPAGANCLAFELAFQTEEYPEFVDSAFNDGFLAELDESDWSVEGASISAPNNFAFDGAGNIVSVNSAFFEESRVVTDTGTGYDGSTPLLEARTPIEPGPHTLYLSIFDATDHDFDSAAFIDRLRAFTAAAGTCQRGARQAPNALNDTATTDEDAEKSIDVLANDSDPDLDPITITEKTNGAHGTVSCGGSSCTYTPDPDYFGTDSFTYRITDGFASDRATVRMTINPVSDPPEAVDDELDTTEDVAASLNVLVNDLDPDDDSLAVVSKTDGTHGSVTCSVSSCTYTPAGQYSGPDSFTYTVSDGTGTDTGTVSVEVAPQNDAPDAAGDSATTDEDQTVQVDVLSNDTDVDGDVLTVTSSGSPSDGSVECSSTTCVYSPDADFFGSDSFSYSIADGKGGTDSATVNVSVSEVQDPPTATNDSMTTSEDVAKATNVLANDDDPDGDTLSVSAKTNGANGAVSCTTTACTYTPDDNWSGTDSYTYTVADGRGGSDTATVNVTVSAVNDAPVTGDDSLATDEDTAGQVDVLANDTDVEGNTLAITSKTNGSNGSVSCTSTACTYTPNANYKGTDSFTYTVSDGNGDSDTGSVEVDVASVNDVPVAANDSLQTRTNTSKSVNVLANDSDVDGDALSISDKTNGEHGTVTCAGNSCSFVPDTGWNGTDSFTYTVSDGNGGSSSATVSVTVAANTPPVASVSPGPATVAEGTAVDFSGAGSSDADGSISSYGWSVSDGRTDTGSAPTITFAENGSYEVTLEVCDDDGACDDATTTVTVNNAPPTATLSTQPTLPLRINTNISPTTQPGASALFGGNATDPGGPNDPLTYDWDFGDGSAPLSGWSSTANHAYKQLGSFSVTLTVTDDDGGVDTVESQPVNVLPTGSCGSFKKAYWGRPGATATVVAKTQFWYVKGKDKRKIRNAYINPGQVVKLQAKPGSPGVFSQVCINNKRYMRVEKVTGSLPTLNYEYLPESSLLRLS